MMIFAGNSTVKQILIWVFMITCLIFVWQFVVKNTGAGQDKGISLTQLLNDVVERWVREDPGQWMWFHTRWEISGRRGKRPPQAKAPVADA